MRERFPEFHRWLGRIYVSIAVIMSLTGFYLTWIRGSVAGSLTMDIAMGVGVFGATMGMWLSNIN